MRDEGRQGVKAGRKLKLKGSRDSGQLQRFQTPRIKNHPEFNTNFGKTLKFIEPFTLFRLKSSVHFLENEGCLKSLHRSWFSKIRIFNGKLD